MKIRNIIQVLIAVSLLSSCAAPKIAYFQDLQPGDAEQVLGKQSIRIQPEDKISILVNSKDPLLVNLFNLPIISRQIGTTSNTSGNGQGISGYTVTKKGNIDFPVLGEVHVAGMTREEIASYIKKELIDRNLVKDPVVTVEFMNLTVAVWEKWQNRDVSISTRTNSRFWMPSAWPGTLPYMGNGKMYWCNGKKTGSRCFIKSI